MKVVFAGTPAFAVPSLEAILAAGHEVVGVVTQPDAPQGRKGVLTPPPVKEAALAHALTVLQPEKIRLETEKLRALGADVMVTCAYGQILTEDVLDSFPLGVYNIHASLLPKYRGASPIQWAVLNGDETTGITVMKTELGLDTGDILLQRSLSVGEDTAGELSERLAALGGECIAEALALLERGEAELTPQSGEVSLVKKITREAAKVDFSAPAAHIVRLIRGMNPSPVAYAFLAGQTVNFFRAERAEWQGEEGCGTVLTDAPKQGLLVKCGDGAVKITELQLAGGKRLRAADLLNGRKIQKGQKFE